MYFCFFIFSFRGLILLEFPADSVNLSLNFRPKSRGFMPFSEVLMADLGVSLIFSLIFPVNFSGFLKHSLFSPIFCFLRNRTLRFFSASFKASFFAIFAEIPDIFTSFSPGFSSFSLGFSFFVLGVAVLSFL